MPYEEDKSGANVRFPPPIIVIINCAIALYLETFFAFNFLNGLIFKITGYCLLLLAIVIIGISVYQFRKAKTHIEPWQPTSSIITDGVFKISRNPIYLAFVVACIGFAGILNSPLLILSSLTSYLCLTWFVIQKEEAYLSAKFGAPYQLYCQEVRRWL